VSRRRGVTPAEPDPTAVVVGDVVGAHALRGFIRVRPSQLPSASLVAGASVLLEQGGRWQHAYLVSAAPHGRGGLLVEVAGVADRNAAEALVGSRILVPAAALPPCDDDEFYWHEVVGFTVETGDGTVLGAVAATFATGLNDVWVVRDGEREVLIPVIADVVRAIDRSTRRIVIEPMPGLIE
jgi:16S rRNA processing protein RimM